MEIAILVVVIAVVFAVAGFFLGRHYAGRDPQSVGRISGLEAQLQAEREHAKRLGMQSAELERDLDVVRAHLEDARNRAAIFEERAAALGDSKQAIEHAFKSLSSEALKSNNQQFLDLAREALVAPVKASLDKVDEKIVALERAREQAYGEIRQQFVQMADTQHQL